MSTTSAADGVGLEWLDGGVAGSILGGVISIFSTFPILHPLTQTDPSWTDRFPAPLFARTVLLGTTFGALEGCLRIAQNKIGRLMEEEDRRREAEEAREAAVMEREAGEGKSVTEV